jgi:hypothetical protein
MRHPIKTIAAAGIGLVLLATVPVAAVPALRHAASGWWHNPERLAALPENRQVHFQDGGFEQAHAVALLLPAAIARVESAQGRGFAHPATIGVYLSPEDFVAANGLGSPRPVAVTFARRVILSPALFSTQRQRLPAILTHELSHAHLQSWMSSLAYIRLPNWFKEGLGVMVSGGGGAEGVTEAQARDAIARGDHIAVEDSGSLFNLSDIKFARPPDAPDTSFHIQLAYRQSGLFVAFLHDSDPAAFARMMDAILEARPFAEAVTAAYGADLPALWARFAPAKAN